MRTRKVLLIVMVMCLFGLVAQAEMSVSTADGDGADTFIGNDTANKPPTNNYGGGNDMDIRNLLDTRAHIGYFRLDITDLGGIDPTGAQLKLWQTGANKTKSYDIYGLNDNAIDDAWQEMEITYNTAPGFLPTDPEGNGNFIIDASKLTLLGSMEAPNLNQVLLTSDTELLSLEEFIKADTNNYLTFVMIESSGEGYQYYIRTKEGVVGETDPNVIPPTLVLPIDENPFWASILSPTMNEVVDDTLSQLCWTNPEPNDVSGVITCDVYFGTAEPNVAESDYGLEYTLATGTTDTCVSLPITVTPMEQYYWVVDVHDSSQSSVIPGRHWSFNTLNLGPVVDAGEDQYVWLTKEIVSTTTSNDTYMRDATDRGGMEYVDVRMGNTTWGFGGYLQFDLSELTALGSGTLSNATLTLQKVAGSRNDTVTNDRFSLQGLNVVAGNTPQDWDEHLLNTDTVGDEWPVGFYPPDLTNGRLADLDEDAADVTEVIADDVITITGADLDAFLQGRVDDNGKVTFVITCEDSGKGYGIASKENSNEAYRPNLTLTYVPDTASNNGDAEVLLDGTVTDDGLPYGTMDYLWEQISGPEDVAISPNNTIDTTVYIGTVGTYRFQLTADDGNLTSSDPIQVYVGVDSCDAAQNTPDYEASLSDFNSDCVVDLRDFSVIASEWLECNSLECLAL